MAKANVSTWQIVLQLYQLLNDYVSTSGETEEVAKFRAQVKAVLQQKGFLRHVVHQNKTES